MKKYIKVSKRDYKEIIKNLLKDGYHTIGIQQNVEKISFPCERGDVFIKLFYNNILKRKEWQFTTRKIEKSYNCQIPYGMKLGVI